MRRTLMAILGLLIGYPVFAFAGYWAIEAIMTAVFAIGPLGAVVGLVAGLILGSRRRAIAPLREPQGKDI
jgi:hypothetical protein